jgi:aspartate racemase
MKKIGLIGGMSWESTQTYYHAINTSVKNRLGCLHSAEIILYSVDFQPIENLQHQGNWQATAEILIDAAKRVEQAGADFLLICTNTMHKIAPQVEAAVDIPLLHIADATANILIEAEIKSVGLLGTAFTMEQDFYKGRLSDCFGLEVLVPDEDDRKIVHSVIYEELCLGKIVDDSKSQYLKIINALASRGAEAVILGCTEIALLVQQTNTPIKLYDTTAIHAEAAVDYALSEY